MFKLDHIAYVVRNARLKRNLMEDRLGFRLSTRFIDSKSGRSDIHDFYRCNGGAIEFVESNDPNSTYSRFLNAHGEGVHHIALQVEDIRAVMADWRAQGVQFSPDPPRRDSEPHKELVTFTKPETSDGLVIELCQHLEDDEDSSG